ncbi:MAG: ACT domain-containing protein [Symbiobacteriaceae bacterium]|nr:ACT domain-containing protein [Symbiobacteriaceae bacterium]
MELQILDLELTVCKIKDLEQVDFSREFVFLAKTDEEISLVAETAYIPANTVVAEEGWRAFRITGIIDFATVGVIAKISGLLAAASLGIFVISTYNTDYVLLKTEDFAPGVQVLLANGYTVR